MQLKTIIFFEVHVIVVGAIIGVLVWRYWHVFGDLRGKPAPQPAVQQRIPPFDTGIRPVEPEASAVMPKALQAPAVTRPVTPLVPASTDAGASKAARAAQANLLKNGDFTDGLTSWALWRDAQKQPDRISIVEVGGSTGITSRGYAARIMDPEGVLLGIHQPVSVVSGGVYKLSARVRSLAADDRRIMFGGRVAIHVPTQAEYELNWVTEHDQWWAQSLVFTSKTAGVALVLAHMGYGSGHSTGDFTNICLERLP